MRLEERVLMALLADPLMPANTVASAAEVLYYDPSVPLKTITLTNNTSQTVYPILTDANSRASADGKTGLYDPIDPLNEEYRGYVGYAFNGQNYLGLRSGQTITINIPLVFWDGGRMDIATDGTYLIPSSPTDPNPFLYRDTNDDGTKTRRFVVSAVASSPGQGLVMWYHANRAEELAFDAPSQLIEMTFRDPYLGTLSTGNQIPASEKMELVNYDVSYVDAMILPVAMQAANVPIPVPGNPNPPKKTYGWVGSSLSYAQMQTAIQAFASNTPSNGLGQYFDGKGYDEFNIPDVPDAGVKLPAGQNLIALSALRDVRSSYDNNTYMLASGGTGAIQYITGGTTNGTRQMTIVQGGLLSKLIPGMVVTSSGDDIARGTTIQRVDLVNRVVILSGPAAGSATTNVYTFKRPVTDYVATTITNLWYSWADYYVANSGAASVDNLAAALVNNSQILTLNSPAPATMVPGMTVTGPGIVSGTTIMGFSADRMSLNLSKLAVSPPASGGYSFQAPQAVPRSSEVQPFALSFNAATKATALEFSEAVYSVMSAMSTVPVLPNSGSPSSQLITNVLGGNIGFIPGINPGANAIPEISNEIRDQIKSVMRGVYDFRLVPETTGLWYPNPATPTPGARSNGSPVNYNVYNLNPFVWFVHVRLGLSGYGFSLDDDVADVGANGSSQLLVSIGGLNGLQNPNEWTYGAPFGPVTGQGQIDAAPNSDTIINFSPVVLAQLNNADPSSGPGALVVGPGVVPGSRVKMINLGVKGVELDRGLTPRRRAGTYTYVFTGSLSAPLVFTPTSRRLTTLRRFR